MNERRDLKATLKAILNDRTDEIAKLDLLLQLETSELDVQGLNATLAVLRILQKSDFINDPLRLVRSQALQTTTALLISAHDRYGATEPAIQVQITPHIESLLSFCNGSEGHLKATAALCLSEMQLCFPGLIGPCVAVIDTVAAFESSPAHQPLIQLLALLATEEQTAAFLAAQLPLLSTPAAASVAIKLASIGSPFLLQSFLHQLLVSFNLTAISVVAKLADLLDEFRRQRLLNHILSLSKDPGLSAASRLVLLDVAIYFSGRHQLNYQAPVVTFADGAHSKLKKVGILLSQPDIDPAVLETILENSASTNNKAVNAKAIYLASKQELLHELCQRLLVSATMEDLSFAPNLLQLLECVPVLEPPSLLTSVLGSQPPPSQHLPFLLLLLKHAVASRSAAVARPKESLKLVAHCVSATPVDISPTLAHQLLSTCQQIIKVFDSADYSSEMTALLAAVTAKCSEEDVVARVTSFESLLGCLTDTKIREVLRAQKKGLVPGLFHRPQAVTILERPLLSLQVAKNITPASTDLEVSGRLNDPLSTYWPLVRSNQSNIEIPLNVVSETSELLEAVAIFFEPLLPFGQLEPLLIGQMSNKKRVTVNFVAERPYPVIFSARAEFRKGSRSCCCPLPDLTLGLASLMQPLLGKHRKQVAKAMWEQMNDWPLASTVLAQENARAKVKELKSFVIVNTQESNMFAAFLAPSSHLLMKCGSLEEATVKFDIKTDDVILLAHTNDFLLCVK